MKSQKFNKKIGATAESAVCLLLNTIHQEKDSMKHGIRGDAWFSCVCTVNEVTLRGRDAVF
jgi:hypothetical protein